MKKRIIMIAVIILIVAAILFSIFIFTPMVALGKLPIIFIFISSVIILVSGGVAFLIFFGSVATGLDYLIKTVKFLRNLIDSRQQLDETELTELIEQPLPESLPDQQQPELVSVVQQQQQPELVLVVQQRQQQPELVPVVQQQQQPELVSVVQQQQQQPELVSVVQQQQLNELVPVVQLKMRYLRHLRNELKSVPAPGGCNAPINIVDNYITISLGTDNPHAVDNHDGLCDPERLIRKDQANLQYRLMEYSLLEPLPEIGFENQPYDVDRDGRDQAQTQAFAPKFDFENQSYYVLVAPPGSGKTFYLKLLTLQAAFDNLANCKEIVPPEKTPLFMPVYINLVEFSQSKDIKNIMESDQNPNAVNTMDALLAFISSKWIDGYKFTINDLRLFLTEEKRGLLFLLDGFDELSDTQQQKMVKIIKILIDNCKPACFIVAKRCHKIEDATTFLPFDFSSLEDFSPTGIYEFANNWNTVNHIAPYSKRCLDDMIDHHPRLQAFAAIPLALSHMACMHSQPNKSLHHDRAELYNRITDDLFGRWNTSFTKTDAASPDSLNDVQRKQLIEYLAWHMHGKKECGYKKEQLKEAISNGLAELKITITNKNIDTIYDELIMTNGLIRAEVGNRNYYRFLCIPLQEYLVSQFLIKNREKINKEFIEEEYGNPWWEEVLMLYISGTIKGNEGKSVYISKDTLIEWLDLPSKSEDKFLMKPIFAGQILAMCKHSHPEIISQNDLDKITARLCSLLRESTPLRVREKIGHILTDLDKMEINKEELAMLSQIDAEKNDLLAIWSEQIPSNRTISPFLLPYLDRAVLNPDPASTKEILYGFLGVPGGLLKGILTKKNLDIKTRVGLVCALGVQGRRELASTLCGLLKSEDIAPAIKTNIARVLGILGDRKSVKELLTYLLYPENGKEGIPTHTIWFIVNSLGMLGSQRGHWEKKEAENASNENGLYLFDAFKNRIIGDNYNPCVRWNMATTLRATFFAKPIRSNGTDSKPNNFQLDPLMFAENPQYPIAVDGAWFLLNNKDYDNPKNYVNTKVSLNDLLDKAFLDEREEVWLYICEAIGQLAFSMENIDKLNKNFANKCSASDTQNCRLADKCDFANQCRSEELREIISYSMSNSEYLVRRRMKALAS